QPLGRRWRQRLRPACDAEVATPYPPIAGKRGKDSARRGVDGHGKAETDAGDRGGDADQLRTPVRQSTARVAWIQGGVGLDDVLDVWLIRPPGGGQRTSEAADDARRHRPGIAERISNGDNELADAETVRVTNLDSRQPRPLGPDQGQVGQRITPDQLDVVLTAVRECRPARVRALDYVGGRDQESVGGQNDGGACACGPAAVAAANPEAGH